MEGGDPQQRRGVTQGLKLWAIYDTPQGLQPMEEAQSKGNRFSKKQQMETLTHTTPTSCISHHLTKGIGRDECITWQNQAKLRLESGEKRYLTETETVLLVTEASLFTSFIGKGKKVHKDPARAKPEFHSYQGIPSEIFAHL